MGDGRLSAPLDIRGLGIRNGERGPALLPGDGCRLGELARPGSTKLLRLRSRLRSDDGDSVRIAPGIADDKALLSLISPASVSVSERPRRDVCEVLRPATLLCERGVGHSIGLFGPVDTAADDVLPSGGGTWNVSGALRIDSVNADVVG